MGEKIMNRTPPVDIRRELRKEVNFGCPIEGCGIPYLTYHHFDPPWNIKNHHNPDGMIALCRTHADLADGGHWTKAQLNEFKQKPFIRKNQIADNFRFLRYDVICRIGCLAYGFRNFITISGETVLGFKRTRQGYIGINMTIRDSKGRELLEMNENDWIVYTHDIFDFDCPPMGKSLRIRTKDSATDFMIRFDDFLTKEFKQQNSEFNPLHIENLLKLMGNPDEIHTLTVLGKMQMGKNRVRLTKTKINIDNDTTHLDLSTHSFIGNGRLSLFTLNEDRTITMGEHL